MEHRLKEMLAEWIKFTLLMQAEQEREHISNGGSAVQAVTPTVLSINLYPGLRGGSDSIR